MRYYPKVATVLLQNLNEACIWVVEQCKTNKIPPKITSNRKILNLLPYFLSRVPAFISCLTRLREANPAQNQLSQKLASSFFPSLRNSKKDQNCNKETMSKLKSQRQF